jgi:hypothetical protein
MSPIRRSHSKGHTRSKSYAESSSPVKSALRGFSNGRERRRVSWGADQFRAFDKLAAPSPHKPLLEDSSPEGLESREKRRLFFLE